MVSGGMTCVKYLLFCFNLLFAISGIAILTIGVITHFAYAQYSHFVYDSLQFTPAFLIGVGVIIFVIAFFGCCGAVKENHCMIITFSVLLLIVFALEVTVGVLGYVKRNEVEVMLENKLNSTMYDYYKNKDIRQTWDIVQHEGECCGMNGPQDWLNISPEKNTLPHTCCPDAREDKECRLGGPTAYKKPCFEMLKALFMKYGAVIGGVGLGIAVSQLIGVVFACCLARSIRKEYETV